VDGAEAAVDALIRRWWTNIRGTGNCNDLTSIATFEIDKSPDSLSNVRSAMSYSGSLSVDVDG
jgi:hypothetical protein